MKHGLVDQADKFKKRVASSDTSNYRVAYKNELVVGFPIDEGVLGFQTKYPAGIVSPAYDIWRLKNGSDSHIPYLERYLRSAQARGLYASRMQGAVARRRSLTKMDFLNLEIPFPPLDDQIRIAHLLGKVEGLIAQRKQHLQQLDDLLKSVFLEMFGDPVRNEREWEKPELKAFGKISTGNTPPRNEAENYNGQFIEWIKTDNITGDAVFVTPAAEHLSELGAKKARTVTAGALLVACIAGSVESIGRAALTNRTVSFNQQINAIQPGEDVNSLYLYGLLKLSRAYIQSHATKGMKKILTKGDFEKITMIKPPFEIQNQFAAIVEKIEALKSRLQQSLTDLEALYGSLSQHAFKGELDLSRVDLPAAPIEGKSLMAAAMPAPITTPVIELPDTDLLLPALENSTQLPPLLHFWLEAYCSRLGSAAFSLERFITAAQTRLGELHPDNDFELGASDYEQIKTWVFEALSTGRLAQAINVSHYDEETGAPVFGNMIELKASQT
ncbi:restriction endonuclease subunit S [Chromobacterium sp. Beijing]|nr:restriction endonuclease subunit S [Chromobacterium sp. Beijing]